VAAVHPRYRFTGNLQRARSFAARSEPTTPFGYNEQRSSQPMLNGSPTHWNRFLEYSYRVRSLKYAIPLREEVVENRTRWNTVETTASSLCRITHRLLCGRQNRVSKFGSLLTTVIISIAISPAYPTKK
jgi:hypothetical protein